MSDRYALLFIKGNNKDFPLKELVEGFSSIGLSLTYPKTHFIKVLNNAGEQTDVSNVSFYDMLYKQKKITFQWWWNENEDLYCSVDFDGISTRVLFGLDGLDYRQEKALIDFLEKLYRQLARQERVTGLIVDKDRGERAEKTFLYPWMEIFEGKAGIPDEYPDIIIVPQEVADRMVPSISHHDAGILMQNLDGHWMLSRRKENGEEKGKA
jgi:hypothetical protein